MFTEDLSTFFNTDEFASAATLGAVGVAGILDLTPAITYEVGGSLPEFTLPTASVVADPRGLSLVVGASTYTVRDFTHDGTGLTRLHLEAM
jgi:hypothetical protein